MFSGDSGSSCTDNALSVAFIRPLSWVYFCLQCVAIARALIVGDRPFFMWRLECGSDPCTRLWRFLFTGWLRSIIPQLIGAIIGREWGPQRV